MKLLWKTMLLPKQLSVLSVLFASLSTSAIQADTYQPSNVLTPDLEEIKQLAGCYLVDYTYAETEAVDSNYTMDSRVYDANQYVVKELIKVVDEGENYVRLQHFMQADSHRGDTAFMMRHHGEIWRKKPMYRYKYLGRFGENDRWAVEPIGALHAPWVREILSLDDGPRYQCLGTWVEGHKFSEFNCGAFAPIPGRESRDMGRSDYNTLSRQSSVISYGNSWIERQNNIKTKFSEGYKHALVKEIGKIWSVRLPDNECASVADWAEKRQAFWDILADVWRNTLDGSTDFNEVKMVEDSTRSDKINSLLTRYYKTVKDNPKHAEIVRDSLYKIIEQHRE